MNNNISRRALTKGAAWAVPAVVATAAIPAYAASSITDEQKALRAKGVRGGFTAKITCGTDRFDQWAAGRKLSIIGTEANYPSGGYFIEGVTESTHINSAYVTLYFENPWGTNLNWAPTAQNRNWIMEPAGSSVPAISGYTPYHIIYKGDNWIFDSSKNQYYTNDKPYFETDISTMSCPNGGSGLKFYAMRSVMVEGVNYSTSPAGPINLAPVRE